MHLNAKEIICTCTRIHCNQQNAAVLLIDLKMQSLGKSANKYVEKNRNRAKIDRRKPKLSFRHIQKGDRYLCGNKNTQSITEIDDRVVESSN